jgi:hypothetical protein
MEAFQNTIQEINDVMAAKMIVDARMHDIEGRISILHYWNVSDIHIVIIINIRVRV